MKVHFICCSVGIAKESVIAMKGSINKHPKNILDATIIEVGNSFSADLEMTFSVAHIIVAINVKMIGNVIFSGLNFKNNAFPINNNEA